MSDNTFIALLALMCFCSALTFCGDPDLHDAVIQRVMKEPTTNE